MFMTHPGKKKRSGFVAKPRQRFSKMYLARQQRPTLVKRSNPFDAIKRRRDQAKYGQNLTKPKGRYK